MKLLNIYVSTYIYLINAYCVKDKNCINGYCKFGLCECNKGWEGNKCTIPRCIWGFEYKKVCKCNHYYKFNDGYCIKDCLHGNFSLNENKCKCNKNWHIPSFFDTINWLKGYCSQFKCNTDKQCELLLPNITSPRCFIKQTNCYCPKNIGFNNKKAKCMELKDWLFVTTIIFYLKMLKEYVYPIFFILMIISIPFGEKKYRCQCYKNNIYFKKCDGNCVRVKKCNLYYDLSLTIYFFKSFIWWCLFTGMIALCILLFCGISLWIIVSLFIFGCFLYNLNCFQQCNFNIINQEHESLIKSLNRINRDNNDNYLGYIYFKNHCCTPLIKLLETYPYFPSNLEGGLVGLIFKTHRMNQNMKQTNIKYILSFDWLKMDYDLRNDSAWQAINNRWMLENYQSFSISNICHVKSNIDLSINSSLLDEDTFCETLENNVLLRFHECNLSKHQQCYNNRNFIQDDECWVCYNQPRKWHKWQCNHVFCDRCSLTFLRLGIICPLCRKLPDYIDSYPIEHFSCRE